MGSALQRQHRSKQRRAFEELSLHAQHPSELEQQAQKFTKLPTFEAMSE